MDLFKFSYMEEEGGYVASLQLLDDASSTSQRYGGQTLNSTLQGFTYVGQLTRTTADCIRHHPDGIYSDCYRRERNFSEAFCERAKPIK